MKTTYYTSGTCSRAIEIDVDDETKTVNSVRFVGGCAGNTMGLASLLKGMKVQDVIEKLDGITCGTKGTSCPAQLAKALKEKFGESNEIIL